MLHLTTLRQSKNLKFLITPRKSPSLTTLSATAIYRLIHQDSNDFRLNCS